MRKPTMRTLVLAGFFVIVCQQFSSIISKELVSGKYDLDNGNTFTYILSIKTRNKYENQICEKTSDCAMQDSVCVARQCQCRPGYVIDGSFSQCLKIATGYYDSCEDSLQCSAFLSSGGHCDNGTCVCREGHHYLHGKCHRSRGLLEKCTYHEECFVNAEYQSVSCTFGRCQCSQGFYQREYSTCRRAATSLGSPCVVDSDCRFSKNATCFDNACTYDGHNATVSNSTKEETITINKINPSTSINCTTIQDCKSVPKSHCDVSGKCVCDRGHFLSEDSKSCIPEIGEYCTTSDKQYKVPDSLCVDRVWTCPVDKVALKDNRHCVPIVRKLNDRLCKYNEQCQLFGPNSYCKQSPKFGSYCECLAQTHYEKKEGLCWTSRKIGENCSHDNDCYQYDNSPRPICTNAGRRFCACPNDTRPSLDNKYCVKNRAELNDICETNNDCIVPNSTCSERSCHCEKYHKKHGNSCLPGYNATCGADNDCKQSNTTCVNKICRCKDNYVKDPWNKCIPVVSVGKTCHIDAQCTDAHANCTGGVCQCNDKNYSEHEGACVLKKKLGENCTADYECFDSDNNNLGVICRNKICSCDSRHKQRGYSCSSNGSENMKIQPVFLWSIATILTVKYLL